LLFAYLAWQGYSIIPVSKSGIAQMSKPVSTEPAFSVERDGASLLIALQGAWTIAASRALEKSAKSLGDAASGATSAALDFSGVERLDTAGVWLIDKARARMAASGVATEYRNLAPEQTILFNEAGYQPPEGASAPPEGPVLRLLATFGRWIAEMGEDILGMVAFLGELTLAILRVTFNPSLTRPTSMVFHLQNFALRAVPIIVTINFLVGCIVEQQGIFQLRRFGAATYAVDLICVLVLRELGVLMTSIMIAGRSGSAITAEIGSMKMREEIDALRVMGMAPMEVLILPRMLALIIALPLLTFLADMAALLGGAITALLYEGISFESFGARLQEAIGMNTYLVGLIKSPFMALVIGMIAAIEGFKVEGSAESLGRHVTDSVVNSIFMVIFVDGLFAVFFASIHY
jgi:phospholipid/cholesterol/gamma-HCH transport system permease protein